MAQTTAATPPAATGGIEQPWPALAALCLGFFMILVDMTIVSVATPAIRDLQADVNAVIWVTSAYLLAYAVPGAHHRSARGPVRARSASTWSA